MHDSREIRALGQQNGIDIFGGNSLGVARRLESRADRRRARRRHPRRRCAKARSRSCPNSGNFTTTIAAYLQMAGWGTTTAISSGKDVYIHYAAPEFAFALANDARSKAAVLYVEPGGYYELDAEFTKPVVACVVGRWKAKLTRAVGHAGAIAGGHDDAAEGTMVHGEVRCRRHFTPEHPVFSAKGALVTNIAHIPAALTAVMRENATADPTSSRRQFGAEALVRSDRGILLPPPLDLPAVAATPYNEQIAALDRQIGAVPARQTMKDASGASQMDARTQLTSLYGVSMLDAAQQSLEANVGLALLHESGGGERRKR